MIQEKSHRSASHSPADDSDKIVLVCFLILHRERPAAVALIFKKIILQLILTKKNGDVWELVTVPGSCPCQGLQRRSCPQRSCPRRRRTGWCMRCKPSLYHLFSNAWVMHSPLKSAVVTESLVWASHSSSEMMLTWIIFSNWQLNDFSKKKPSPPLPAGHLGSRQGRRPEIPNLASKYLIREAAPIKKIITVNASTLSSVVGVQVSQAGWGVDVQVNRLGELEKGDVVGGGQWIVVVLMDNRVNFQCYIFPDESMRIQSESTCLCRRHCWGQTHQEEQWGRLLRSNLGPWLNS